MAVAANIPILTKANCSPGNCAPNDDDDDDDDDDGDDDGGGVGGRQLGMP